MQEKEADRTAILVIVIGLMTIHLFIERLSHPSLPYVALTIGVLSILSKSLTRFILTIWEKIGQVLGWINTRILLGAIYYIFLFPIAMLARLSGKDALLLKSKKRTSAYWTRNHVYTKGDLDNIW